MSINYEVSFGYAPTTENLEKIFPVLLNPFQNSLRLNKISFFSEEHDIALEG